MARTVHRVAVIGGGITGLAAALQALTHSIRPEVVVFEAAHSLGGKIRTTSFAGHSAIDEGPDAFLARVPWGTELARAVGLGGELVSPAVGRAAVWWDRMHPIPEGLMLGLPTGVTAVTKSSLISWRGKLRASSEPFRRRTSTAPDSLGAFVRHRFGDEVHERLVDPLIGSIYAADTDRFSLAAVQQIAALADSDRSLLLGARRAQTSATSAPGPVFFAPVGGMSALVSATSRAIIAAGGEIRLGTAVGELAADGKRWRVNGELFDAVVLAAPARSTANMLASVAPVSSDEMRAIGTADVAIVSLSIPSADWPARLSGLSGYLVPKPKQRLVTAVSFGSQKWAHWHREGTVLLRVSLGRDALPVLQLSDDALLAAAIHEVSDHLGRTLQPTDTRVSRWEGAFPQYRPHHAQLVAAISNGLPTGLVLAGASFHGIGIPACIRSGQAAAAIACQPPD